MIEQPVGCLGVDAGAEGHSLADQCVVHRHDARPEVSAVSETATLVEPRRRRHSSRPSVSRRPPRSNSDHPGSSKVMTRDHLFVMDHPTVSAIALLYTYRKGHEYGTKVPSLRRRQDEDAAHHEVGSFHG